MQHNRRLGPAIIAVAGLLWASGCANEAHLNDNGNTVVFHQQQEPDALNPYISEMMATIDATAPILEGLTATDDRLNTVPVLAEQVPTAENGLVKVEGKKMIVTYPLRKGVKWHDGKPFTAEDVKFTFDVIMHPKTMVTSRTGYEKIERVEVVDAHTVRMVYSEVFAPYQDRFSTILPKHLLAEDLNDDKGDSINKAAYNRRPVGTGPYKFKSWVSGDHIAFEAFDGYWRGKPKIQNLKMRIVPDENAAFTLLKSGELDIYQSADISKFEAVKKLGHVDVVAQPALTWELIGLNVDRPQLSDLKVRQAIAHAINKKQISEKIYQGLYPPAYSDQTPLSWAYNKKIENYYPYDPEKAQALLEEAGWKEGLDGIRVKDGQRLSLKITTVAGRKARELTELVLKYYFKKVGIELVIDNVPGTILFGPYPGGTLKGGKFDLGMWAWVSGADPDNFTLWHSSQISGKNNNGQNSTRFRDAEMDALLVKGTQVLKRDERAAIYKRTAEILAEKVPVIPLLYWANINPVNKRLKNFKPNPSNQGNLWNCYEWEITPSSAVKASKE